MEFKVNCLSLPRRSCNVSNDHVLIRCPVLALFYQQEKYVLSSFSTSKIDLLFLWKVGYWSTLIFPISQEFSFRLGLCPRCIASWINLKNIYEKEK